MQDKEDPMKTVNKLHRTAALFLCAAMLFSCAGISASAEEAETALNPEDIRYQTIGMGMAAWLNDSEPDLFSDLVLWDAAGWYAALKYRESGQGILWEKEAKDFLASFGYQGDPVLPEAWEEYGIVRIISGAGKSRNYDFQQHKKMFDAMVGITAEFNVQVKDSSTVIFSVTDHAFEREKITRFLLTFAENDDEYSIFPYKVVNVEPYQEQPEWDERLNFTWDELMNANYLPNILSIYPCVRVGTPAISADAQLWLFKHNDTYVRYNESSSFAFGVYGMYSFEMTECSDGLTRPSVSYINYDPLLNEEMESYVQNYLTGFHHAELIGQEDDLIWLKLTSDYGYFVKAAVDAGTLVIRELQYFYDNSERSASENSFVYTSLVPSFEFLSGWDLPLRTVTAVWENYDDSIKNFTFRTETVQLPYNWEYFPAEAKYGDYTVYTNPRYIGDYTYPGDWIDYSIFLTTAKG